MRHCKHSRPSVSDDTEPEHVEMTDQQMSRPSPAIPSSPSSNESSSESIDPRIERSRASVVQAAAQLLLDDGPDAITHARVADAAGVSRTTVYKHYPERSDLLFATAEAIGKNLPDPGTISGDLRIDLTTLLGHLATDLRDPVRTRVIAMTMERALHDDAVALVRDTFITEIREAFATIVSAGVDAGQLAASTDVDLALASLAGSLLFSRFLATIEIEEQLVSGIIENFIRTNAPR